VNVLDDTTRELVDEVAAAAKVGFEPVDMQPHFAVIAAMFDRCRSGSWADGTWTTRESSSLRFLNDDKSATFTLDAHEVSDGGHKPTTKNPPSFSFWVLAGTNWSTDDADTDQAPQCRQR
jgi:hypothetical protein